MYVRIVICSLILMLVFVMTWRNLSEPNIKGIEVKLCANVIADPTLECQEKINDEPIFKF